MIRLNLIYYHRIIDVINRDFCCDCIDRHPLIRKYLFMLMRFTSFIYDGKGNKL